MPLAVSTASSEYGLTIDETRAASAAEMPFSSLASRITLTIPSATIPSEPGFTESHSSAFVAVKERRGPTKKDVPRFPFE